MWQNLVDTFLATPDFHMIVIALYHFFFEVPDTTWEYCENVLFPN